MSAEDLERYESDVELQLYQEYRDVFPMFRYSVETERRYYLTNKVDVQVRNADADVFYDVAMEDVWVWDMYRPTRFARSVRVLTFKDVNIEDLSKDEP
jgi:Protein of unknown function (DUF2469)